MSGPNPSPTHRRNLPHILPFSTENGWRLGRQRASRLIEKAPRMRTPVLIVGGGPVGLALAGELGWRGVSCTLIEQGDGVIGTPKMNEVNIRTMEFCRRWGIADAVH